MENLNDVLKSAVSFGPIESAQQFSLGGIIPSESNAIPWGWIILGLGVGFVGCYYWVNLVNEGVILIFPQKRSEESI